MTPLAKRIISGEEISFEDMCSIADKTPLETLLETADDIRRHFFSNKIETCAIVNAKSGLCPENCKWCAQSAHNATGAKVYPMMEPEEILEAAERTQKTGIKLFSVVTSGRRVSDADTPKLVAAYHLMKERTSLGLCGSLGLLTKEQLRKLKEAGMARYHCNLETAPSFFGKLCTTHTMEDKLRSIGWAREVGLKICSGGIIGMGETRRQRVEFAFALKGAGAMSIPVNVLNPIKGTPLENAERLPDDEILLSFAIFKLVNPQAHIRFAGGRTLIGGIQQKALKSGVDAAIMGDMLTTSGPSTEADFRMFAEAGYEY